MNRQREIETLLDDLRRNHAALNRPTSPTIYSRAISEINCSAPRN